MFDAESKIGTAGYSAFLINQYLVNSVYISMLLFSSSNSNNFSIKSNIQKHMIQFDFINKNIDYHSIWNKALSTHKTRLTRNNFL